MFFEESRPDRRKRALRRTGAGERLRALESSPVPPAKSYEVMTDNELYNGGDRTLIFDVESYPNYFLVSFKCEATGKILSFENSPISTIDPVKLGYVIYRFRIVGFNSRTYDLPMIMLALQGADAAKLKQVSDEIIFESLQPYEVERRYNVRPLNVNHIDLIEVAPIQASLKIYAGRLHCQRMQDLPYQIDTHLTQEQAAIVRDYNINDLDNTELLFRSLKTQIELRETLGAEYKQDLRSKSDAQIAEAVISSELDKIGSLGRKPTIQYGSTFNYRVPDFLGFQTPQLSRVLEVVRNATFIVGTNGKADTPKEIDDLQIRLGGCVYRMGNGGLHSSEKSVAYQANERCLIIDRDVESYYPNIILNQGLYPQHLGPAFLEVFRKIVFRRMKAKHTGDKRTSESLKITINGTFGKLGNVYSNIYSPDLLSQVTISGQLCLLMLIEMVELVGIPVASANTDGIVILCPPERYEDLQTVIIAWEERTGFITEETRYHGIYSRDVNNYIAVKYKQDPETKIWLNEIEGCKVKGFYSERGSALNSVLSKNPENLICSDALQAFLAYGTPIAETVRRCQDVRRFVTVRTVKGGAEKDGRYLGKAVRWYLAQGEPGVMTYVLSGNAVPKSQGARPLMELPDQLPHDLDIDRYIAEATEMLFDVGFYKKVETRKLF